MSLSQIEIELRLLRVLVDGPKNFKAYLLKRIPSDAIINLKEIWDVLVSRISNDMPIDLGTLRLTAKISAVQIGYLETLRNVELCENEVLLADLTNKLLLDYRRMVLLQELKPTLQQVFDEEITAADGLGKLLDTCQQLSFSFSDNQSETGIGKGQDFNQVINSLFTYNEHILPTGFKGFDDVAGGLAEGDLVVISAPTSSGKTCFALQMAINMASAGSPTLVYSLEISSPQVWQRMIANKGDISFNVLRDRKHWTPEVQAKVSEVVESWNNELVALDSSLVIKDCPSLTVTDVMSDVSVGGAKVIFIDYINMMVEGSEDKQWQKLMECSRKLKILARSLKVAIVILAQYDDKEQQVRYSRGIKENCDLLFSWILRDREGEVKDNYFACNVEKGRNIPIFKFGLKAEFEFQRITDCDLVDSMNAQGGGGEGGGGSSPPVERYSGGTSDDDGIIEL